MGSSLYRRLGCHLTSSSSFLRRLGWPEMVWRSTTSTTPQLSSPLLLLLLPVIGCFRRLGIVKILQMGRRPPRRRLGGAVFVVGRRRLPLHVSLASCDVKNHTGQPKGTRRMHQGMRPVNASRKFFELPIKSA